MLCLYGFLNDLLLRVFPLHSGFYSEIKRLGGFIAWPSFGLFLQLEILVHQKSYISLGDLPEVVDGFGWLGLSWWLLDSRGNDVFCWDGSLVGYAFFDFFLFGRHSKL